MPKQPERPDHAAMAGEVDRLLRQLRPQATPRNPASNRSAPGHRPPVPSRPRPRPSQRRQGAARTAPSAPPSALVIWGRVVLGAVLAVALTQWPYRVCGLPLGGYLTGASMVLVTGGWAARGAWRTRMGWAHVVAILLLFAGAVLAAYQVLPRVGWAPVAATWRCTI